MVTTTFLGCLFQCLSTLLVEKFFPILNLSLPWSNLGPFPLVTCYLGEIKQITPDNDPSQLIGFSQAVVKVVAHRGKDFSICIKAASVGKKSTAELLQTT